MPSLNTKLATAPNTTANYVLKATTSTTIGNSLIFDNGTNVGIGTASPFAIADTNLTVNGTTSSAIQLGFNGTRYGQFYTDSGEIRLSAVANLPLTFYSNNLERMRITSGGELLINATTNGAPNLGYQLGVRGTNANSLISIALANQTLSTQGSYIGLDGTVGYIHMIDNKPWIFSTNNTERMRIAANGNVGIGTTSPTALLQLTGNNATVYDPSVDSGQDDGGVTLTIRNNDTSTVGSFSQIDMMVSGDSGRAIGRIVTIRTASATSDMAFVTESGNTKSEKMRITSGGCLAINNPSDKSEPLSVQGFSGNWTAFFQASTTAGNSYGPLVYAGTSSGDTSFYVASASGASVFFRVRGDGYIQLPSTYNNTTTNAVNLTISSSGYLERYTSSSLRYKENIAEWNGNGLDTILALKPVQYTYKSEYYKLPEKVMLGLIAEEVEKVSPYFVDYENEDRTGQVENVRYADLVLPLIKAVQELNQKLQDQQQTINSLINR